MKVASMIEPEVKVLVFIVTLGIAVFAAFGCDSEQEWRENAKAAVMLQYTLQLSAKERTEQPDCSWVSLLQKSEFEYTGHMECNIKLDGSWQKYNVEFEVLRNGDDMSWQTGEIRPM